MECFWWLTSPPVLMRIQSHVHSYPPSTGVAFPCPRSGNLLCLPGAGVCTQCCLLNCSVTQQNLLKESCLLSLLSLPKRWLSQALCGKLSSMLGAKCSWSFLWAASSQITTPRLLINYGRFVFSLGLSQQALIT